MPLTTRTNGSSTSNIIQASWFNDFLNLLTGSMTDQPVTVVNSLSLKEITYTTPTAASLALAAGSALGIGSYTYAVSFAMGNGVTVPGTTATITTTSGNQQVNLTSIPTGPAGTTGRIIWRSKVGTSTPLYRVTTISDNTTTTYLDSVADASLVTQAPSHDTFGGSLFILNSAGTVVARVYNDGSVWFDAGKLISDGNGNLLFGGKLGVAAAGDLIDATTTANTVYYKGQGSGGSIIWQPNNGVNAGHIDSAGNLVAGASIGAPYESLSPTGVVLNGATSGTATVYQTQRGTWKEVVVALNNFWNNGGTTQTIALPTAFTTTCRIETEGAFQIELRVGVTAQTITIITGLASGGGSFTTATNIGGWSFGACNAAVDTIGFRSGGSGSQTGFLTIRGV